MAINIRREEPAPPPLILQAEMGEGNGGNGRALVQRTDCGHIYLSVDSAFYPSDDAREFFQAGLDILDGK